MKNTSNLNLGQPLVTEYYDINVQNDNMDIIDTAYKNLSDDISDLTTNVDTLQTANNDMSETLSNLSTDVQTLQSGAISASVYDPDGGQKQVAFKDAISDAFSEEVTYSQGDYCIYENQLYKFTADHEAGPWIGTTTTVTSTDEETGEEVETEEAGDVEATLVASELASLNGKWLFQTFEVADNVTIDSYSSTSKTAEILLDGYTPISVCNVIILNGSSSGKFMSFCNCYKATIEENILTLSITNLNPSYSAIIKIMATVIYKKNE